ncbi:MAG: GTP 3',8-cyclase MoaA [Syntrophorhabdaceae bacterium]|nr:GTP 3',8-cyclase MoaA [Syntrophorhabdaceae bacterium]MDD4196881.1 GTP 3',8-cyclase MoaA [Syntrophorhabdaceae bacterium]
MVPRLIDDFNRVIDYVRISITDRCNLRCRYCIDGDFPFIPHTEVLSYEEIVRFVRICAAMGVTKVRLTGGEPLTRKDLPHLLKELAGIEGITDISLTTNAVLLADKIDELKEAGLKRVNISLDTLRKDRFTWITCIDAFDRVIDSIKKASHSGLRPIKINTVIIKGFNDDEILDFVRIARKWDHEIRFIEFMPFGSTSLWKSAEIITSKQIEDTIRRKFELVPSVNNGRGPAKVYEIGGGSGRIGFISPVSSHICAECNRIRLTAGGMIRPCLFSDVEYDVKSLLRSGADDEAVKRFVRDVVKVKPERKLEIGSIKKCQRTLRNIGG